jgi:hypothetical protein
MLYSNEHTVDNAPIFTRRDLKFWGGSLSMIKTIRKNAAAKMIQKKENRSQKK